MFTSTIHKLRDQPGTGAATIVGVLLIVALLWAVGQVAQGQVSQARARDHGQLQTQVQAQAMALRCASAGAARMASGCDGRDGWPSAAEDGAAGQPVYASYR